MVYNNFVTFVPSSTAKFSNSSLKTQQGKKVSVLLNRKHLYSSGYLELKFTSNLNSCKQVINHQKYNRLRLIPVMTSKKLTRTTVMNYPIRITILSTKPQEQKPTVNHHFLIILAFIILFFCYRRQEEGMTLRF